MVLYVRVRVDGFFDEGAVWCPAAIACFAMIEQLGLFVACQQRGDCRCYLNGTPLHNDVVAVTHGDFLAIFKSDHAHSEAPGHAALSIAANGRQGGYLGTVPECRAEQCVLKLQVRVVQMLSILSIRTNHEGDSLPRKRRGGLASAMAWSDVCREVFWSFVQRNHRKLT